MSVISSRGGELPSTETLPTAPQPTAADLIIQQSNSKILGDKLRADGVFPPDAPNGGATDYAAHHIVPSAAGDARMDALRAKLQGLGIDLNSAANGVWLPGPNAAVDAPEAYHRALNSSVYRDAVLRDLANVSTQDQAIDALSRIGSRLQAGNYPGSRPNPRAATGG